VGGDGGAGIQALIESAKSWFAGAIMARSLFSDIFEDFSTGTLSKERSNKSVRLKRGL
jgi:hypothetical protein